MNRIMYMAVTVNGLIAREDDDTNWISDTEWDSYSQIVRAAGCMIIGRRTYDILTKQPEFSEFEDVKVVVVSHSDLALLSKKHRAARSPTEALATAKDYEKVIIAGGSTLNSAFMSEGLIDEIYLDVEPLVLGKGLPLFSKANFTNRLELLAVNKLSANEIQLHYKVKR